MARKFITTDEIAKLTGYCTGTVYAALRTRGAPKPAFFQTYGRRLFDRAAVVAFFAKRIDHRTRKYRNKRRSRK